VNCCSQAASHSLASLLVLGILGQQVLSLLLAAATPTQVVLHAPAQTFAG